MYYHNFDCIKFNHYYNIRSKKNLNITSVLCTTTFGQHSPVNMGIKLCKNMEIDVKKLESFKHIKTHENIFFIMYITI